MTAYLNFVAITAAANGTTSHTVNPASATGVVAGTPFTPTAGRRLVVVADGSVTSTTPSGWTLPSGGSAINLSGLYVWHRVAAGGDTFSTTHNASNYAVGFAIFEFPASTTFVGSVAATGQSIGAANPNLTGLTGSNTVMGAAAWSDSTTTGTAAAAWGSPNVEVLDVDQKRGTNDGFWLGIAYQDAYVSASYAPAITISSAGTGERLTFAVTPPSGAPAVSSTMAVSARVSTAFAGQKVAAGSFVATAHAAAAFTGGRSVSSTLTTSARSSVTLAGRKTVVGTLAAAARASVALAAQRGALGAVSVAAKTATAFVGQRTAVSTIGVAARASTAFSGSAIQTVSSTMGVSSRTTIAASGRKGALGTLQALGRASTASSGRKNVTGALTATGRASTLFGGSTVFAKSSTMTVAGRTAVAFTAGGKGIVSTLSPTARTSATMSARKGALGAVSLTVRGTVALVGRKSTTGTLQIASHASTTFAGARILAATATMSVSARMAIVMTGALGDTSATYGGIPGGSYGADPDSMYADAVGTDPRISTYGG